MIEGEILLTFGDNLRQIINDRRLSVAEAARRCGIPLRNMRHYIDYETLPRPKQLVKICDGLCTTPAELYALKSEVRK